jgi:hypothetical protein
MKMQTLLSIKILIEVRKPRSYKTQNWVILNQRLMLHIISLSSFYHLKIDVALKITIEFMIDHY